MIVPPARSRRCRACPMEPRVESVASATTQDAVNPRPQAPAHRTRSAPAVCRPGRRRPPSAGEPTGRPSRSEPSSSAGLPGRGPLVMHAEVGDVGLDDGIVQSGLSGEHARHADRVVEAEEPVESWLPQVARDRDHVASSLGKATARLAVVVVLPSLWPGPVISITRRSVSRITNRSDGASGAVRLGGGAVGFGDRDGPSFVAIAPALHVGDVARVGAPRARSRFSPTATRSSKPFADERQTDAERQRPRSGLEHPW